MRGDKQFACHHCPSRVVGYFCVMCATALNFRMIEPSLLAPGVAFMLAPRFVQQSRAGYLS